jgi:hypothetical protein
MRWNISEIRKRRELVELQAQFESEERLLEEAQRRLEAVRAPPAPESHGAAAHANPIPNPDADASHSICGHADLVKIINYEWRVGSSRCWIQHQGHGAHSGCGLIYGFSTG